MTSLLRKFAMSSAELPAVKAPSVYLIVLNWNGIEDTFDCLNSLADVTYDNFTVVVVDNGSTDTSLVQLQKFEPIFPFTLIPTGKNLGFAEGNNVGIRHALTSGADFILLLNNDTTVSPSLLTEFVSAAGNMPDAGILTAKIFFHRDPKRIWYAGGQWKKNRQFFQHVGIGELDDHGLFDEISETDYASGCALFIRRSVAEQVGLMDARFFLTYEETDWCYRVRAAGYRVLFIPSAKVWHKVSVSFGGVDSPLQTYFYSRNLLLWAERHLSPREYYSLFKKEFKSVLRFGTSKTTVAPIYKRLLWATLGVYHRLRRGGSDGLSRARYLGFRDYVMRRFGDCPDEVRTLKRSA